jgi:hypothetical protein
MYVKSKTVRCATNLSIIEPVRRNQQLFERCAGCVAVETLATRSLSARTLIQYVVQPAIHSYCFTFTSLPLSFPIWIKEINYSVLSSRCWLRRPDIEGVRYLIVLVTKRKENNDVKIVIDLGLRDVIAYAKKWGVK